MGNKRIYETKIINKCKKDVKKNIRTYKGKRWHMENLKKSDELNKPIRDNNIINYSKTQRLN
jgi:hypothetical protein